MPSFFSIFGVYLFWTTQQSEVKSLPKSNFAGKRCCQGFCLLPSSAFLLHSTKLNRTKSNFWSIYKFWRKNVARLKKFNWKVLSKKGKCIQCCRGGGWPARNFKLAACQNPNIYNSPRERTIWDWKSTCFSLNIGI